MVRTGVGHPAPADVVACAAWWNTVDGHAHGKENAFQGGLLAKDLGEKAVYRALRRLIREEWRSHARLGTTADGQAAFTGFRGGYRVAVQQHGQLLHGAFELSGPASGEPVVVTCRL